MASKISLMNRLKTMFRQLFTGKDNKTLDLGRVLWAKSVLVLLAVALVQVYKGNPIDFMNFGAGIAAVLAAGGAAIGLKSNTEPGSDTTEQS